MINFYRRLSPTGKLRVAITCAVLSAAAALVAVSVLILQLEKIPAGEAPDQIPPTGIPAIELTLVDYPDLSAAETMVITKSMSAVMARRLPGDHAQMRVVVYGAGIPIYIQADGGLAGYLGDLDVFFIDVTKAREAAVRLKITQLEAWAYFMGHEATHLVQHLEGRARRASRGDAYHADPLEREAFQEGFDLLIALKRGLLYMTIRGVSPLTTAIPNPYTVEHFAQQNPIVTVRSTWTLRGSAIRALRATGLWTS